MAEHKKQPSGFAGRASGSVAVTCERCGAALDVLCLAARDDAALAPYAVRCPGCAALLQVELPSPPIAVMPHHG